TSRAGAIQSDGTEFPSCAFSFRGLRYLQFIAALVDPSLDARKHFRGFLFEVIELGLIEIDPVVDLDIGLSGIHGGYEARAPLLPRLLLAVVVYEVDHVRTDLAGSRVHRRLGLRWLSLRWLCVGQGF